MPDSGTITGSKTERLVCSLLLVFCVSLGNTVAAKSNAKPVDATKPASSPACDRNGGLTIWDKTQDMLAGSTIQARLYSSPMPGVMDELPAACVESWVIDATPHASIDHNGQVTLAKDAPDGTIVTFAAIFKGSRINARLRVYDPAKHPLAGRWQQIGETPCDGSPERAPVEPLGELVFDAGGGFSVTKVPFEVYKDYWGSYRHDVATGDTEFTASDGNQIPKELDLKGSAKLVDGKLELKDIVLWPSADGKPVCGMRFK